MVSERAFNTRDQGFMVPNAEESSFEFFLFFYFFFSLLRIRLAPDLKSLLLVSSFSKEIHH